MFDFIDARPSGFARSIREPSGKPHSRRSQLSSRSARFTGPVEGSDLSQSSIGLCDAAQARVSHHDVRATYRPREVGML